MTASPSQQRETLADAIEAAELAGLLMPVKNRNESAVMLWALTDTDLITTIIDAARRLLPETRALERVRALCEQADENQAVDHPSLRMVFVKDVREAIGGGE